LDFLQKKDDKIDDVQPDPMENMSKLNDDITTQQVDEISYEKVNGSNKCDENMEFDTNEIYEEPEIESNDSVDRERITNNEEQSDEVVKKDWGNSFLNFLQNKEDKVDDVLPDPIEILSKINDKITNPEITPQQVD
jgi:hypothetical protein